MAPVLRVVVDPGVLVSAAIAPIGPPGQLLDEWRAGRFEMVVSPMLLAELRGVLSRDKFRRYLTLDEVDKLVTLIRREAELRADPTDIAPVTPDPNDDYLIALAVATGATLIVSGDQHLTQIANPRPAIMSPSRFVDLLEKGD